MLVLANAKEDAAATRELIQKEAEEARGYGNYGDNTKEIVVDIEDAEKKQYYETNYDTSECETLPLLHSSDPVGNIAVLSYSLALL